MYFRSANRRSIEKRLLVVVVTILILVFIASPFVFVQAFGFSQSLTSIAKNVGFDTTQDQGTRLPEIIGLIIYGALGMIGVLFLVLAIVAGFRWMTAAGNEEQVTQARKSLINAAIGVMIVLSAYAITYFILKLILPESTV